MVGGLQGGAVCYGRRVDGAQEGGGVSGDLPSTTIKLVSLRLTKHCALGQSFRVQVRRLYYNSEHTRNLLEMRRPQVGIIRAAGEPARNYRAETNRGGDSPWNYQK